MALTHPLKVPATPHLKSSVLAPNRSLNRRLFPPNCRLGLGFFPLRNTSASIYISITKLFQCQISSVRVRFWSVPLIQLNHLIKPKGIGFVGFFPWVQICLWAYQDYENLAFRLHWYFI